MARATVLGRLTWRAAAVAEVCAETATATTLTLTVPGWPGHLAGQHVDVRLTAEDGYTAVRSYSIAAPPDGDRVRITVQQVDDGEVSPYLAGEIAVGDTVEVRGPVGGWFVWRPEQTEPVQLVAGGSGIVPLMAMLRARAASGRAVPFRLLYSARSPESVIYQRELVTPVGGLDVSYAYTRSTPAGWSRQPGRVDAALVDAVTWPASIEPTSYVCGPTPFVETVADLLVRAGHAEASIRTERFGGGTG